ncbi:heme ABC transporter ATP-binding protein [Polycladidibacter hongkongensis]|uniref:heme ABC transporter ATP-binding protein n=1 Tax=Polycladidibacter hongkongensis TaxID=1647556 RepID=UPI0008317248|nr:heme ABC transporter ATP-binding protein [Pseudovibrio hongkongensis]
MLSTDNLGYSRGKAQVLRGITACFRPGEISVIIGPNGAGKSSLLGCLTGELKPTAGKIELEGRHLASLSARDLAARRAVLAQSNNLSFPFTVTEVIALGATANAQHLPSQEAAPLPPQQMIEQALAKVGLLQYANRLYQQLSGGEKQRVQLARVLCQVWYPVSDAGPSLLFLDEPTAGLDLKYQFDLMEMARGYAKAGGCVIAVLHELDMAYTFADQLLLLENGTIAACGKPEELDMPQLLKSVYKLSDSLIAQKAGASARLLA